MRVTLFIVALGVLLWGCLTCDSSGRPLTRVDPADPNLTMMVAALDDPIDPHRNVMWCAAFLVACEEIRSIQEASGTPTPDRVDALLDRARSGRDVLPPDDYLSFGGPNTPEFLDEQLRRFRARFPGHTFPDFDDARWVGYCVLHSQIRFTRKYSENPVRLEFTDSLGNTTKVRSFGYSRPAGKRGGHPTFRYRDREDSRRNIVDLDGVAPIQLLAIGSPKGDTLQSAWSEAKFRMGSTEFARSTAILAVPEIGFSFLHDFPELFEHDPLTEGSQEIWFALDESGAEIKVVASVAKGKLAAERNSNPNETLFNQPFLLAMRVRGQEEPFFLLWIRNTDILIEKFP